MNNIFTIALLILIISCQNNVKSDYSKQVLYQKTSEIKKINEYKIPNKQLDTLSFEYFVSITDVNDELPKYMIDSFIGSDWLDDRDPYRAFYGDDEFKHYSIYENTILSFNMATGGICTNIFLATFDKNGEMIDSLAVSQVCDADITSASYSFNDYEIIADTLIKTFKHTTQAIHYKYSLPDSVDGLDDVKTKEIIKFEYYFVKTNGSFEKTNKIE